MVSLVFHIPSGKIVGPAENILLSLAVVMISERAFPFRRFRFKL